MGNCFFEVSAFLKRGLELANGSHYGKNELQVNNYHSSKILINVIRYKEDITNKTCQHFLVERSDIIISLFNLSKI